jgi:hypothetical protein
MFFLLATATVADRLREIEFEQLPKPFQQAVTLVFIAQLEWALLATLRVSAQIKSV